APSHRARLAARATSGAPVLLPWRLQAAGIVVGGTQARAALAWLDTARSLPEMGAASLITKAGERSAFEVEMTSLPILDRVVRRAVSWLSPTNPSETTVQSARVLPRERMIAAPTASAQELRELLRSRGPTHVLSPANHVPAPPIHPTLPV